MSDCEQFDDFSDVSHFAVGWRMIAYVMVDETSKVGFNVKMQLVHGNHKFARQVSDDFANENKGRVITSNISGVLPR